MIFEVTMEEFEELMLTTIEPTLLVLLLAAFTAFIISSYKKGEIRLFAFTLLLMAVGIIFAMFGIFVLEGIMFMASSVVAVIAAIILRIKTEKMEG